jgi:hypothetical protein
MLGGLLILFIYIISLTPNNQMIRVSPYSLITFFILPLLKYPTHYTLDYHFILAPELTTITKTYFPALINTLFILAFILLFALLIIVYIVQFNKGALRTASYAKTYP